jgi:hypothetical protein
LTPPGLENLFRIFRICSEFSVMFRICSEFSEFSLFSEYLAQKLVCSESLDFVVHCWGYYFTITISNTKILEFLVFNDTFNNILVVEETGVPGTTINLQILNITENSEQILKILNRF